ncbi:MAG: Smr/MutS family protein [Bacteroidales bacterium]|nr:Smr/MutS family protein [Bacteroidales bacterium]
MVIYPQNFEEKIDFTAIRKLLKQHCISEMGTYYVDKISFSTQFDTVQKLLQQTEEFRAILAGDEPFPAQDYIDMRTELMPLRIAGTFIEQESLLDLKASLSTLLAVSEFFQKSEANRFPELKILSDNIIVNPLILKNIESIVDDKGEIRDSASEKLHNIRKERAAIEASVFGKVKQALIKAKSSGYTADDVEITVRNGRLVIPVISAYKRNVPGFIHDESSSGQTTYIEPAAAFEMNNEIRDLLNAERREIIRILTAFTDLLRPDLDEIINAYRYLGLLDFIRAKASFALEIGAILPNFQNRVVIDWMDAMHPLLYLTLRKQTKPIVPLTLSLDADHRILVISGPNAGGKSICLKTIGLLQYMLQCGLLVPMKENSQAGMFHHLFIDIGDEQSLENDLSTYSSHLLNMKHFVEHGNSRTLFLIDEFGTGTEPTLGGAIAEAVLDEMNHKKSFGVVTTHYANLKLFADKNEGVVNGAMLFDIKALKPLFRLHIGKPGSSFAFEIATKIGFPNEILKNAMNLCGEEQASFDQQLQQLEIEKENLKKEQTKVAIADSFLAEVIAKYQKLATEVETSRKNILSSAHDQAKQILSNANKLIENTIREIKEAQADKEKVKTLRHEVDVMKENLDEMLLENPAPKDGLITSHKSLKKKQKNAQPLPKTDPITIDHSPVKVGDYARMAGTTAIGKIAEIKKAEALLMFDSVATRVKLSQIEKVTGYTPKKRTVKSVGIMSDINERKEQFSLQIDLRGERTEDALVMVESYLDEAVLVGVKDLKILHGKGNGILRQRIRSLLSKIHEVEKFRDEENEFGGTGITLVTLR